MIRPEVVKDQASQTLIFESVEGRPSATPTVGTKDSGGAELSAAADTNVTLDAVNTTINASASIGDKSVTVASVSDIDVGRVYLITNALLQWERVRVTGVDSSGKIVYLDEEIEHAYTTADTFVGTRFVYDLQDDDISALAEMNRATATYTVAGRIYRIVQAYDVVLNELVNPITNAGIKARWPDLSLQEYEEQLGEDYKRQRDLAWEQVKRELRQLGKRPALIVTPEDLEDWSYWHLALRLQESGQKVIRGLDQADAIKLIETRIDDAKDIATATLSWEDKSEDEVLGEGEDEGYMLDFVR